MTPKEARNRVWEGALRWAAKISYVNNSDERKKKEKKKEKMKE